MALAGVTDQIVYLDDGDLVDLQLGRHWIVDKARGRPVERPVKTVQAHSGAAELGPYRHYMQKEIFEQPRAIADTLEGVQEHRARAVRRRRVPGVQGDRQGADPGLRHQLLQPAWSPRYWLELIAKIPTQVEIASEYRYRERARPEARWWSPSRRAARPPTPWPRSAMRSRWA
jgi:glucosamine--fructose-6-phosphate aminotransferase (isomerizing)